MPDPCPSPSAVPRCCRERRPARPRRRAGRRRPASSPATRSTGRARTSAPSAISTSRATARGALAYVKRVDGVDRVFVARFVDGAFQAARAARQRAAGASSQPVVGAADAGRLVVVFVNAGTVYGVVRPAGGAWSAPTPLGGGGDPAVDLSINGTAFASFTADGDVRVARLDRRTNAWTLLAQPADVDPAKAAGVGGGRSRVAISADGIGVVTWGEGGHVYARKMFGGGLSNAPQDLTPADFGGRVAGVSELPEIDAEDDSSYAWVVFRQTFADGGTRILARRQRGTSFDDAGRRRRRRRRADGRPRIDLNGRGVARRDDERHADRPADVGGHRPRPVRRRRAAVRPQRHRARGGARRRAGDRGEQRRPDRRRARHRGRGPVRAACERSRTASSGPSARCRGRSSARSRRSSASTSPPTARAARSWRGSRAGPRTASSSPATSTARRASSPATRRSAAARARWRG